MCILLACAIRGYWYGGPFRCHDGGIIVIHERLCFERKHRKTCCKSDAGEPDIWFASTTSMNLINRLRCYNTITAIIQTCLLLLSWPGSAGLWEEEASKRGKKQSHQVEYIVFNQRSIKLSRNLTLVTLCCKRTLLAAMLSCHISWQEWIHGQSKRPIWANCFCSSLPLCRRLWWPEMGIWCEL